MDSRTALTVLGTCRNRLLWLGGSDPRGMQNGANRLRHHISLKDLDKQKTGDWNQLGF